MEEQEKAFEDISEDMIQAAKSKYIGISIVVFSNQSDMI